MIKIEKCFIANYDPYIILKNKELLDYLFDDIYKYNKHVKNEGVISFGKSAVIGQLLSFAGFPNFIGAGVNFINKSGKEYHEQDLINYLLLYCKERQENIYRSAALIVLFVGASAHQVASIKSATTALQIYAKATFKALINWNISEGIISLMKDQVDLEKQILIRINQSIFAFSMNLYFSDIKCDISIILDIVKDFSFDTSSDSPLPIFLDLLLDYSFGNNLGILTDKKVRNVYSNQDTLKQYVNNNGYEGESIDFFMKLIVEGKDLLAEGKFSRDKE